MSDSCPSDSSGSNGEGPHVGQVLRRRALGTTALYRVIGQNTRGVEVEVVDAPGLKPGTRFTFTLKDVLAMDYLDSLWDDLTSG
jgi:hypothetical protein